MTKCYHCKKAIRSLKKAEFFALVQGARGGVEEAWIHNKCLDAFNGKDEEDG